MDDQHDQHLHILWTDINPITAEKMVFMYGFNALQQGWWENVTIIIWGATVNFAAEDTGIQEQIKKLIASGVAFSACKACADQLGATEKLEQLGIEVIYWGRRLTNLLKSASPLLTI